MMSFDDSREPATETDSHETDTTFINVSRKVPECPSQHLKLGTTVLQSSNKNKSVKADLKTPGITALESEKLKNQINDKEEEPIIIPFPRRQRIFNYRPQYSAMQPNFLLRKQPDEPLRYKLGRLIYERELSKLRNGANNDTDTTAISMSTVYQIGSWRPYNSSYSRNRKEKVWAGGYHVIIDFSQLDINSAIGGPAENI
ncbi:hypothetical protein V1511DRAFT_490069 [Dipodascopsis uninucleata]